MLRNPLVIAMLGIGTVAAPGAASAAVILDITSTGTATIDTGGLTLNSFIVQSYGTDGAEGGGDGFFTGSAILPATPFQINNADEASATFINVNSNSYDLGQLVRLDELPLDPTLLTFTYTYVGGNAIFDGEITGTGIVPEPASLTLIGVGTTMMLRRRR